MPITDQIKTLVNQKNPDYINGLDDFIFWRHAINANLDGGSPRPIDVDGYFLELKNTDDRRELYSRVKQRDYLCNASSKIVKSWLYPTTYESEESYFRRAEQASDSGFAQHVTLTYGGHFMDTSHDLSVSGLPSDVVEKIEKNIDNAGNSYRNFISRIFTEMIGMGRGIVAIDNPSFEDARLNIPSAYLIPREHLIDWAFGPDGKLTFAKWFRKSQRIAGFTRETVTEIYGFSESEMFILQKKEGKDWAWKIEPQMNPLGEVPVVFFDMGEAAKPIIETAAKNDVSHMNMESIVEDILTKQGLCIPYVPDGAQENMSKNADGSIKFSTSMLVIVPENGIAPDFAAFPANSIDGHFKFLELKDKKAYESANLRRITNEQISGRSKEWDWQETKAILTTGKNVMITGVNKVIYFVGRWVNSNANSTYVIGDFSIQELKEQLENIRVSLLIDLAEPGNIELRKKAYNLNFPESDKTTKNNVYKAIEEDETSKEPFPITLPVESEDQI